MGRGEARVERVSVSRHGVVVVRGRTGSGKRTYGWIAKVDGDEVDIRFDPVPPADERSTIETHVTAMVRELSREALIRACRDLAELVEGPKTTEVREAVVSLADGSGETILAERDDAAAAIREALTHAELRSAGELRNAHAALSSIVRGSVAVGSPDDHAKPHAGAKDR